jgi:hypothetical protein
MKDDLWGTIPTADTTPVPATVLKEQGRLLSEKTNGILSGIVKVHATYEAGRDVSKIVFFIVCPTLNNYRYEVLLVNQSTFPDVFPVEVVYDKTDESKGRVKVIAHDVEEFKTVVKDVLQSDRVKRVIAALLRDAQEFDD